MSTYKDIMDARIEDTHLIEDRLNSVRERGIAGIKRTVLDNTNILFEFIDGAWAYCEIIWDGVTEEAGFAWDCIVSASKLHSLRLMTGDELAAYVKEQEDDLRKFRESRNRPDGGVEDMYKVLDAREKSRLCELLKAEGFVVELH